MKSLLAGCEHEFRLMEGREKIDFRDLIHRLTPPQPRLDPADHNAHRLGSGVTLTCDEGEAELSLPPTRVEPGFTETIQVRAAQALNDLKLLLPPGVRPEGYSTHISVSIDDKHGEKTALLFARSFAPAMMLLMDAHQSPGLLVRPRPNRIELGGEYVNGIRLRAALAMAVGSVHACAFGDSPPKLALRLTLDDRRYGWFVDRRAFGMDLYREGRKARLRRSNGGTINAQEQLEASWMIARNALAGISSEYDLEPADRMVAGEIPLPIEDPQYQENDETADIPTRQSVYGKVFDPRHGHGFDLAPVMATWEVCVFVIVNPGRTRQAFVCVPLGQLEHFVDQLDCGELDEVICKYLSQPARGRRLYRHDQTFNLGFYDVLGPRWKLLASERHPRARQWQRLLTARWLETPVRRGEHDMAKRGDVSQVEGVIRYG